MKTNGTAMSVSRSAYGARAVALANEYASQPETARHTSVSATIQVPGISRSSGSPDADAPDDRNVLTSPPTTGWASLASVQRADTPIVPAPMKRTCVRQMVIVCDANDSASGEG